LSIIPRLHIEAGQAEQSPGTGCDIDCAAGYTIVNDFVAGDFAAGQCDHDPDTRRRQVPQGYRPQIRQHDWDWGWRLRRS